MSQVILGVPGQLKEAQTLRDTAEDDFMFGGGGNDTLLAGSGTDLLFGGAGDDQVLETNTSNTPEFNQLYGGEGNDYLESSWGYDTMDGGPGDDAMFAYQGNNALIGGEGDDFLGIGYTGGAEFQNNYSGGSGNDVLVGAASRDIMDGGPGFDALRGLDGNDELRGGDGYDLLNGEGGNDVLEGGGGLDTFVFGSFSGNDTITDFVMERLEIRGATSAEQTFVDGDDDGVTDDLLLRLPGIDPPATITLLNQNQELTAGQELYFLA